METDPLPTDDPLSCILTMALGAAIDPARIVALLLALAALLVSGFISGSEIAFSHCVPNSSTSLKMTGADDVLSVSPQLPNGFWQQY